MGRRESRPLKPLPIGEGVYRIQHLDVPRLEEGVSATAEVLHDEAHVVSARLGKDHLGTRSGGVIRNAAAKVPLVHMGHTQTVAVNLHRLPYAPYTRLG